MRYRYLDDFWHGISVFAIFSYGIAVLGTPQCPPPTIDQVQNYGDVLFTPYMHFMNWPAKKDRQNLLTKNTLMFHGLYICSCMGINYCWSLFSPDLKTWVALAITDTCYL